MEVTKIKPIEGFEEYLITTCGKVWSLRSKKFLKKQMDRYGYIYVHLNVKERSKKCKIHRLVALAYIPNPLNKPQVNHEDGIKLHNYTNNLIWSTNAENMQHAFRNGLCKAPKGINNKLSKKIDIYNNEYIFLETLNSIGETSNKYKKDKCIISSHCNNKTSYSNDYIFRFKDEPIEYEKIIQMDAENNILNIFYSIVAASLKNNLKKQNIGAALNGIQKTCGGFYWKRIKCVTTKGEKSQEREPGESPIS